MPAFEYTALDSSGRTRRGVLEGDSGRLVRDMLREMHLSPLRVEPTQKQLRQKTPVVRWWHHISAVNLALITRQLATLVNAGLPVEESLLAVAQQSDKRSVNSLFMTVRENVLAGRTLAQAMENFPGIFSSLYRSSIAAGERSGYLDSVLENLADFLEERFNTRRDVEMAMFYPLLLFVCAIAIVILLMTYVIPDLEQVFLSTGASLPFITELLIQSSRFLRDYFFLVLIGLVATFFALYYTFKIPVVSSVWQRVSLRLPFAGWLIRNINLSRYVSTLAILGKSGVPLNEAMEIATQVVSNNFIKQKLSEAAGSVREGTSLAAASRNSRQFPPIYIHMIESGERSGALTEMLEKSSEFQNKELRRSVETMVQLLRPLILLFMAGIVLLIMMAVLLPILNMNALVL